MCVPFIRPLRLLLTLSLLITIPLHTAHANLTNAYKLFQKGKWQQAQSQLNKLPKHQQNAPAVNWLRGHIHYAQRQFKHAQTLYMRALVLAPTSQKVWLYNDLGNTFFQRKQWPQAIRAYSKALAINPNYERARYNLELAVQKLKPPPPPPPPNKSRKPPPPPPPNRTTQKKPKKPPKVRSRGLKPPKQLVKLPKAQRLKLKPFDRFIPYWRVLRHQKNKKQAK